MPPLAQIAAEAGIRRVHLLAWRDLDDPEAGGSEVHASTVAKLWAEAGIEVTMRTSAASGHPAVVHRDGYRVIRRADRYTVFPRAAMAEVLGRTGPSDALVEIWNGMPFLSPLWHRGPRAIWLHHVHGEMWQMMLPGPIAAVGNLLEHRLAPPLYRRSPVVTLAESSRQELIDELRFDPSLVTVVPPGIDPAFRPGGARSETPLVVAVGRLTPVKRFHLLIDALVAAKCQHPSLDAYIVGEGFERPALEAQVVAAGAGEWLRLPGRLPLDDVIDLYRRAWFVASTSAREGWGMTITEAAACGTPAIASRITGHADAVVHGVTGRLADQREFDDVLSRALADPDARDRMAAAANQHAARFTWEATAEATLRVLADDARRRRRRR